MLCAMAAGCSETKMSDEVKIDIPESFTAEITKNKQSFCADIQRDGNGSWSASFTAPETVSGLKISLTAQEYTVASQGLTQSLSVDKMPSGSIVGAIASCLDHAANSSDAEYSEDDGDILISGEVPCGEYVLRTDKKGRLLSLTVSSDIYAEFDSEDKK